MNIDRRTRFRGSSFEQFKESVQNDSISSSRDPFNTQSGKQAPIFLLLVDFFHIANFILIFLCMSFANMIHLLIHIICI